MAKIIIVMIIFIMMISLTSASLFGDDIYIFKSETTGDGTSCPEKAYCTIINTTGTATYNLSEANGTITWRLETN